MSNDRHSFWTTIPGILTGIAAIITAATGFYVAVNRITPSTPEEEFRKSSSVELVAPLGTTNDLQNNQRATSSVPLSSPSGSRQMKPCANGSLDDVRRIVASLLIMNPADVDVRRPLGQQALPADDLDFVEIILAIEEQCSVTIEDSEVAGMADGTSVEQLARLVDHKLK